MWRWITAVATGRAASGRSPSSGDCCGPVETRDCERRIAAPVNAVRLAVLLGAASLASPAPAPAQEPAPAPAGEPASWHFAAGERATYRVTFGRLKLGWASLAVEAVDTLAVEAVDRLAIRAGDKAAVKAVGTSARAAAYRVAFELRGGPFFYRVDDRQVSWVALRPLRSLRFEQRLREGGYRRRRRFRFDHAAGSYSRWDFHTDSGRFVPVHEVQNVPMPPAALDEIAFLFLARLLPLKVGQVYRFDRYFDPKGNPVVLEVLRRETVRVPAGRFRTIVVRPLIRTSGMFGEGGRAELFLSDDARRVIVQLKTHMKVGELNMYLASYDPGGAGTG